MFGYGQLERCQQRKAELVQRSSAHRQALMSDSKNLRPLADWVDWGMNAARSLGSVWNIVAPLWTGRGGDSRRLTGVIGKIAGALTLVRALRAIWKNRR